MGEHERPVRANGIAVVRFQTAVLWSFGVASITGLLGFFAFRLVQDQDRTNQALWAEIKSNREAFQEYKITTSTSHEALVTRITVLETQFGTITLQLADLKAGQKELLRR
jgi:uncharacterized membrane-anchored protein YhcB (DUF1043 family)